MGLQLWTPGWKGEDLLGKASAVCGLRENQGQCVRAVLKWRMTNIMFSECKVVLCVQALGVNMGELPFNISLQSIVLSRTKFLHFGLYIQTLVSFLHRSSELSLGNYSPAKAESRLSI